MTFSRSVLVATALVALLSACGGDDNDEATPPVVTPPPPTTTGDVPNAALVTPTSFVDYVGSLPTSATAPPLNVNGVNPPTTETGSPKAL